MQRMLFATTLLLVIGHTYICNAETWTEIYYYQPDNWTLYYDPQSIERMGKKTKVTYKIDFKSPKLTEVVTTDVVIDCAEGTYRAVDNDQNVTRGEILFNDIVKRVATKVCRQNSGSKAKK